MAVKYSRAPAAKQTGSVCCSATETAANIDKCRKDRFSAPTTVQALAPGKSWIRSEKKKMKKWFSSATILPRVYDFAFRYFSNY